MSTNKPTPRDEGLAGRRRKLGVTQSELAAQMGGDVSHRQVHRLETGRGCSHLIVRAWAALDQLSLDRKKSN